MLRSFRKRKISIPFMCGFERDLVVNKGLYPFKSDMGVLRPKSPSVDSASPEVALRFASRPVGDRFALKILKIEIKIDFSQINANNI